MLALAEACQRAGQFDRADGLLREALVQLPKWDDIVQRKMNVANARGLLAKNLLMQQQYAAAEPLAREAVATFEKYRPDNPNRFKWTSVLGAVLLGQRRDAEAEPLLLEGYNGLTKQYATRNAGNKRQQFAEAGERLVHFYEVTGQVEKVREWQAKLSATPRAK